MGILMETAEVKLGTNRPAYRSGQVEVFATMDTPVGFYSDTIHTIAINTRETDIGSIVEPIPITLKAYRPFQPHGHPINGYGFPPQAISSLVTLPRPEYERATSVINPAPVRKEMKDTSITRAPPKKKWIREYLEEEPKSPVSVRVVSVARSNGVVPAAPPPVAAAAAPAPPAPAPEPQPTPLAAVAQAPAPAPAPVAQILDFAQEHSRPRTTSNSHGPTQIPSPPSAGSSGSSSSSAPRAGTREVHNKLEKNRRAHLKECFEMLKRQLPTTPDDKKTSNLSILGSAIRYIQVLRRKERECEHEMERLAREKIAAQQRLATLKREVTLRATARPRTLDSISDDKNREDRVNGHVLGLSIASSPPRSPPQSLNLSTKLRALPIQITPTTSQQVVRNTFGARHNTVTLTTLADQVVQPNGQVQNGVTNGLSTIVHPAQIHLPISQVVGGGVVMSPATLQLLSAGARLQLHHERNGVTMTENNRIPKPENGIVTHTVAPVSTAEGGVVVSGLPPLVVSPPGTHLLHAHTLTHKMVDPQMVKGSVAPLTVSAQYLSTAIVKPVVVVSTHSHT